MKKLVQLEQTNFCNRTCFYCGIHVMKRPKGMMSDEVFERCVEVALALGQPDVGMHHYGESLIHPKLLPRLHRLNEVGILPYLYTNGDLLTDAVIEEFKGVRFKDLVISGHMEEGPRRALWQKCVDAGIRNVYWQTTLNAANTINLAGQLPGPQSDAGRPPLADPEKHCRFLVEEHACVLWNGDLVPCCVDYEGHGVFGNIMDRDVTGLKTPAFSLCDTCPGHPGNVV